VSADRETLVRHSVEAWNADDFGQLESLWRNDGTIVSPEGWPEAGTFEGWDALVAQWRRIKDSWEEEHVELLSTETVGERVLASARWMMRGEASGAPLEVQVWMVYGFSGDRIRRIEYFLDERAARAALEERR
jgi:ketosteroid isomerase-like protein